MSFDRALGKAMRYCSYQERCKSDLTNRLTAWNVEKSEWKRILDDLFADDFLNETRYVEAFVRGKFNMKRWGKNKIKMGLMSKHIFNEKQFEEIFDSEIGEEDYLIAIKELIEKKSLLINDEDELVKRDKIYRYMLNKGYESELVANELNVI